VIELDFDKGFILFYKLFAIRFGEPGEGAKLQKIIVLYLQQTRYRICSGLSRGVEGGHRSLPGLYKCQKKIDGENFVVVYILSVVNHSQYICCSSAASRLDKRP